MEYLPHKELQSAEILLGVMKSQTGRVKDNIVKVKYSRFLSSPDLFIRHK